MDEFETISREEVVACLIQALARHLPRYTENIQGNKCSNRDSKEALPNASPELYRCANLPGSLIIELCTAGEELGK
jgi:hypothetical protein